MTDNDISGDLNYQETLNLLQENNQYRLITWNDCYGGGPSLSKFGKTKFNQLKKSEQDKYNQKKNINDIILLILLNRYNHKTKEEQTPNGMIRKEGVVGPFSEYGLALIKEEYYKYVRKHEYDGLETVFIDSTQYIEDKVNEHFKTKQVSVLPLTKERWDEIHKEAEEIQYQVVRLLEQ